MNFNGFQVLAILILVVVGLTLYEEHLHISKIGCKLVRIKCWMPHKIMCYKLDEKQNSQIHNQNPNFLKNQFQMVQFSKCQAIAISLLIYGPEMKNWTTENLDIFYGLSTAVLYV